MGTGGMFIELPLKTTGRRRGAGRLEAARQHQTAKEDYQLGAAGGAAGGSERGLDEQRYLKCERGLCPPRFVGDLALFPNKARRRQLLRS